MRLTIDKEQLLKALNTAGRAVPSKSASPILSYLKLELYDRGLEIVGSNGDLTICSVVPFKIGEKEIIRSAVPGKTLVNGHLFTEYIRRMDGTDINITVIDNAIAKIEGGRSSSEFTCANADEYLDVDFAEGAQTFTANCSDFASLVEQTAFAASTKEQRPVLMAINFEATGDGKLVATATDSARLSQKTIDIDGDANIRCNVPAKILSDVVHLFEDADTVRVSIDGDRRALFRFANTVVSTRLIRGDYPVGKSIIPQNFNYFLEVNAQELLGAMSRASLLTQEKDAAVKLTMSEDSVRATARNEGSGSADEEIRTFSFTGDSLEVAFNPAFVMDAIKAVKCEDVTLCFQAEMKPFVIKNPKDPSVVELILPKHAY